MLVVDDDVLQASVLADILRWEGLDARMAIRGDEALAQIDDACPDVLVLDAILPDMTAGQLIARARARRPALPAVVVTGYPRDEPRIADAIATVGVLYLPKPVDVRELLELLARATRTRPRP